MSSRLLPSPLVRTVALALAVGAFTGCGSDDPLAPAVVPTASLTVDASSGWAFVTLGNPASAVSVQDPATSGSWDIAFNATKVMVNGGANGPAGVQAYCFCQNRGATDAQVLAMTAESQLAAFEAVGSQQVPSAVDPGWGAEAFVEDPWYRYNLTGNHQISPTFQVYLVKRGAEVYKLQLTNYYGPAGETRQVTLRYARIAG